MDDIKRALLGDKEAAKRLTEAGALVFLGVLTIFIFVIRQIAKTNRKWRR